MRDPHPIVDLDRARDRIARTPRLIMRGRVIGVVGPVVEATAVPAALGDLCRIVSESGVEVTAEVVGFHDRALMLMPLGSVAGIAPGAYVQPLGRKPDVGVSEALIGRVLDGLGRPMDQRGRVEVAARYPLEADPPNPLHRSRIERPLGTGIRAVDGLLTIGRGQRIGIFAGSGVGKSILLGMIARQSTADVNVIALLGERGREVREFIERDLGPEGLRRSVVVVATSDQPALVRANGALVATAVAEYFRDLGLHVVLMMDSVTRVGMALREVGLSVGEPPATKGYPPSVFASLARLMERAGTGSRGSISGLYTVLVEADDFNEPLSDHARSVLDGHILLSRQLAAAGHYPAIDVLESVSRVRDAVVTREHLETIRTFVRLQAAYRGAEDLIAVGAYQRGTDREVDAAVSLREAMNVFLRQQPTETSSLDETVSQLAAFHQAAVQLESGTPAGAGAGAGTVR